MNQTVNIPPSQSLTYTETHTHAARGRDDAGDVTGLVAREGGSQEAATH